MEKLESHVQVDYITLEKAIPKAGQSYKISPREGHDRNKVYSAEKALLAMVREGDINYHDVLNYSAGLSPGVPVKGRDPLRQAKTNLIVFTTLVCRAAMEGGLSPEIAYPLGDHYIQAAEDSRDIGELESLAAAMYHDFIFRVHHANADKGYSYAIQKCCDYIELSVDRKIHIKDLAILCGYSEYYLSEKFKSETGVSINTYIKKKKIDRAKLILKSTEYPVSGIAEHLAFNTTNYFIQCFKEETGITPAQYRKQHHG